MIKIEELSIGDRVHYYKSPGVWENGIVKELRWPDGVWAFYGIDSDWNNFGAYTTAKTELRDLFMGWRDRVEIKGDEEHDPAEDAMHMLYGSGDDSDDSAVEALFIQRGTE